MDLCDIIITFGVQLRNQCQSVSGNNTIFKIGIIHNLGCITEPQIFVE